MWICSDLLWMKQIGEFFRLVVAEMRAHTVMKFFFMRNELVVPTDGAKLLEQFFPRWMSVLWDLRVL
jgi:hypothetical protein